jgi:hypothetical protein
MRMESLGSMDAKTFHRELMGEMTGIAKLWITEKARSFGDYPLLPDGERGLEIGFGCAPREPFVCRKVLLADGRLIWLNRNYTLHGMASDEQYLSEATLQQVENATAKRSQV